MLRVLTYNIHKGFCRRNRDFVLHKIRDQLESLDVDIVFLQEIQGRHDLHADSVSDWPSLSQFEYLADNLWPHFAYGKNAIYSRGHHGNAILSKYAIEQWKNINFSRFRRASRSLLHGVIRLPERQQRLHLICVHFELIAFERRRQLEVLRRYLADTIDSNEALILAGDFNDWNGRLGRRLESQLSMQEAFRQSHGQNARTYPARRPLFRMDRVYFRHMQLTECECLSGFAWQQLSDHLPLYAQFSA